jgi:transglutaminase-like putative cysteine protease
VLTGTAWALVRELALPWGTGAAMAGTFGAAVVSAPLARSRVRLPIVWAVSAACAATALLLGLILVDGTTAARTLGPYGAMAAADLVRFGLLGIAVTLAIRTTSARRPAFAITELGLVVMALAGVVSAHRDGAINHPRFLSDWAWSRGIDPVILLLAIGGGTLGALLVASLHERRGRGLRVALHVLLLMLLAGAAVFLVRTKALDKLLRGGQGSEQKQGGKGDEKGQKQNAGGGGSGGGSSNNPLPFRNDSQSQSTAPVAVVLLHDDYSPPLGYYYFRQKAFSQWNGHRLVAATRDDVDKDLVDGFPAAPLAVEEAPRPGDGRTLVHTTVALLADHPRPFGLEAPMEFQPRESPDPSRFVRAYDVASASLSMRYEDLLGRRPGVRTWTDEQRAHYTQLPDDPRYKQLADKIVDDALRPEWRKDPFAQALAISAWLGKESIYSLKSQHLDDKDPTADFLFGDRIGYCVHFAHSAAYLLRARGLPARIAEGYAADESRRGNGSAILLRQKDAHAWAELYLDGFGWIIVDVAPQRVLDPPDTPPDPDLQHMLGELARGDKTAGKSPDGRPQGPSLGQMLRAAGFWLLLFFEAVVALLYLVKAWRRLAPFVAPSAQVPRVAYRAALDQLAEIGERRGDGETRERFAARVAGAVPSLTSLTRLHLARAFRSRRPIDAAEVRGFLRRTGRERMRSAKWYWIALGWLDPTSWLRAR